MWHHLLALLPDQETGEAFEHWPQAYPGQAAASFPCQCSYGQEEQCVKIYIMTSAPAIV
jgi:hypothetical protein